MEHSANYINLRGILAQLPPVRELGFGAGMGLPNMKRYTDDMKVESKVGEGTVVTLIVNINS